MTLMFLSVAAKDSCKQEEDTLPRTSTYDVEGELSVLVIIPGNGSLITGSAVF